MRPGAACVPGPPITVTAASSTAALAGSISDAFVMASLLLPGRNLPPPFLSGLGLLLPLFGCADVSMDLDLILAVSGPTWRE